MSRTPSNAGLISLLKMKERETGLWFQVPDVARLCHCSRMSVWNYTTGRSQRSKIEPRMAAVFGLTVPELRKILGLKGRKA